MDFRKYNHKITDAIRAQLGGVVIPFSQMYTVWSEGKLPRLTENLLVLGNRVRRMQAGRESEELQVQIEWEDRVGSELVQRVAEMSEENPLGVVDQAAIQKILGGSDPALVEVKDREGRKIRGLSDGSQWSLEWVGFLPRNTAGLNELLRELGASSLTEKRAIRKDARKHREHNSGAFFPYCLNPATDSIEQWKNGKEKGEIDRLEMKIEDNKGRVVNPWKGWYCQWVSACWEQLVHFGVPGVQELMFEQNYWFGTEFNGFNAEAYFSTTWVPWFEKKIKENNHFIRKEDSDDFLGSIMAQPLVGKYWIPTTHCAIAALEENVDHQATEAAKEVLKQVIRTLLTNDYFVKKERVPFSAISKAFKDWPYVIETKRWYTNRAKPQWVLDKLPKNKWKENVKKPDCVRIKMGLWSNDHYFYWKEDVNQEFQTSLWPIEVKYVISAQRFACPTLIPSMSSGRMMQKLIDGGFLKPLSGINELYAGINKPEEKDPQKQMMEEFDRLVKNPELFRECCVVDREEKLMKKLGTKKVNRLCLFAGDTEAFIDPVTGKHSTSMLIIKNIFDDEQKPEHIRKDPDFCWNKTKFYSWNMEPGTDIVHKGMITFMEYYMNYVAEELFKHKPDWVSEHNWNEFEELVINHFPFPEIWFIKDCLKKCGINPKDTILKEIERPIIYFHNLGYDIQPFLCAFAPSKREPVVKNGAVWYRAVFKCKYGEFELRNSLTIITTALRNFPKMFLPKEEQQKMVKEVYAYNAINQAMVEEKIKGPGFKISLEKFKEYIELFEFLDDPSKQEKLYNDIVATASRPEVKCIRKGIFDVGKYAEYYCERDVDLLCLGLRCWAAIGEQDATKNTFKGLPPFKKFDVFNFLSAPAIAQAVTEAEVRRGAPNDFNPIDPKTGQLLKQSLEYTYKYKGLLRKFMLHATTGGRCTLANEKRVIEDVLAKDARVKEIYEKVVCRQEKPTEEELKEMFRLTIQDFDARSLYPTAMSRSFIPLGMPELVDWRKYPKDQSDLIANYGTSAPTDAMYLITNIRYERPLAMPSNCWKQEKPEPRCRWANDIPFQTIQLRKLTDLYTMIETQHARFDILGGLEWRGGKATEIQEFMKKTYEFRRLNHSGGFDHPVQESAKLVMNSFYGKNVTKMREFQEIFFPKVMWKFNEEEREFYQVNGADNLMDYLKHNWRNIKQVISVGGSFAVKVKAEDNSAYDANFGCEVLAGARALICRVSAAIELITKQPPLYTDTDSLHVYGWQIEAIADWFEKKFHIPMIGGELGQFHPDFEPQGFKPGEKFMGSIFFCGVGKKMYIDEIVGDQGSTYFHKRAKGIRAEWLSKEEYIDLFNGKIIEKDCDKLGGVNIRAHDGSNFTVRLIKKVKATAEDEVEVEDDIRTINNEIVDNDRTETEPLEEAEISKNTIYVRDDSHVSAENRPQDETEGDTVIWNGDEDTIPDSERRQVILEKADSSAEVEIYRKANRVCYGIYGLRPTSEPIYAHDIAQMQFCMINDDIPSVKKRFRNETEDQVAWSEDKEALPILQEKMFRLG